jgi:hypothetical protein
VSALGPAFPGDFVGHEDSAWSYYNKLKNELGERETYGG